MTVKEANINFQEKFFIVSGKTVKNVELKIVGYDDLINSLKIIFDGKSDIGTIVHNEYKNKIQLILSKRERVLDITNNKELTEYIDKLFLNI